MPKKNGFDLSVRQPCEQSWDGMRSEGRGRFCESCGKVVQDLALLSDRQVEELAMRAAAGERVCGRVTRRSDGELVTLGAEQTHAGKIAQRAVLATVFATSVPLAAQQNGQLVQQPPAAEVMLKEVPPEPQPVPGKAVVIGRLLHPDGTRVETGLVYVEDSQGVAPLYVVDASGWFEIHATPGVYNFVVQTGKNQVERVPSVVLHEGVQQFPDLTTRDGRHAPEVETVTTMGEMVPVLKTRWGWHALRHPILYARYVVRNFS